MCEQLAGGCYPTAEGLGVEPATAQSQVGRRNHYTSRPHITEKAVSKEVMLLTGCGAEHRARNGTCNGV